MKFSLKPDNRGLKDNDLLEDLRSVAHQLSKNYVTKIEYEKIGRLSPATFQKRFGSWGKAHELAGLKRVRNFQANEKDCIEDIQRVAALLNVKCITTSDYKKHGKFSLPLISKRAGSWHLAVKKAGLAISPQFNEPITDNELFENLEQLWEGLGRQPTVRDFIKPHSRYSYSTYPRRFGSYRKALEAFIAAFESEAGEQETVPQKSASVESSDSPIPTPRKTSRSISWRMRFLVMRRDNFRCKLCGISPATKPGTVLVVDHIKAWSSDGETEMDNLQTLCEPCNGGKSNLPLNEV